MAAKTDPNVGGADNAVAPAAPVASQPPPTTASTDTPKQSGKASAKRGLIGHVGLLVLGALNLSSVAVLALTATEFADRLPGIAQIAKPAQNANETPPPVVAVGPPIPTPPAAAPTEKSDPEPPKPSTAAATTELKSPPAIPPPASIELPTERAAQTPTSSPGTATAATTAATNPEPEKPAPKLSLREADVVQQLDAVIAPIRDQSPSVEDATRIRDAFAPGISVAQIKALRDQIADPVGRKLVEWQLLRNGAGPIRDVRAFLDANPDWPNRDLMIQRAEEQVFMAGGTARDIKAIFAIKPPKTMVGEAALASALLAEQNEAEATKLASKVWRSAELPALLETGFIERFAKLLTEADHKWRFDRYIVDDSRWENERAERAKVARRIIPFLTDPEKAKANARLAVYLRTPDAGRLLAALPTDAATLPSADWGFAYQLAQWHRRNGRSSEAWNILLSAPTAASEIVSPDDWWSERRYGAYEALKAGQPDMAYDLVKAPGQLGVNAAKDANFLAGWLALKYLSKPEIAETHFNALAAVADGPLSRGKAGYWLAKTYDALGQREKSKASLVQAARNPDTFYGLLARQLLDPSTARIEIPSPRMPTPAEAAKFTGRDAVQAVVLARKSGLDETITRVFLSHLRNTLTSESEQALLAHLAEAIGDTQWAVRIGKQAVARGLDLLTYAYPIHALPAYTPLRPPPETAMLLGIARQESEFNTLTRSGAGATGLLQVMPITAQHVCRDYKIKCELDRLSSDPTYNVTVASAYIGDRMDEFNGSYVLTLAGYNAGPGRARQWVREFGDPRDPKVDPIDWIHRIPFEETREYVLKVLSNIQIYRARLGEEASALRLEQDLRRSGNLRRPAANGG